MNFLSELLINLAGSIGDPLFIAASIVLALLLSFVGIPYTTDMMVNSTAGLAGKYFGPRSRTLFINASTNNPEAFSMLVSFGLKRMGGWSNPLGSLFANIYLMYGVALIWVFLKFLVTGKTDKARELWQLIKKEKKLFAGHVIVAFVMFGSGWGALQLFKGSGERDPEPGLIALLTGLILAAAMIVFYIFEKRLKDQRPELFDEMNEDDHNESWFQFILGTTGVIFCCWVMNELFLAWSEVYQGSLSKVFGPLIFLWLHYFVGALITSLPEMNVAIKNFEHCKPADLNTALGSASYSNLVNLGIAFLGLIVWFLLALLGVSFSWT